MKLSTHAPVHAVLAAITLLPGGVHAVGELCDEGDWGCGGGSGTTPYWSQTCAPSNCCCAQDPFRLESCTNFESEAKGCGSCMGKRACYDVGSNVKIGDNSCTSGDNSCARASGNSVIWNDSCKGDQACQKVNDVTIGPNSCKAAPDESGWLNCFKMAGSTVGSNSCNGSDSSCSRLQSSTVGDGSCQEYGSCYANCGAYCGVRLSIGTNTCNYDSVCSFCENDSVIPDNACNYPWWDARGSDVASCDGDVDPKTGYCNGVPLGASAGYPGGKCNYCLSIPYSTSVSAKFTPSARRRLTDSPEDFDIACQGLAAELWAYNDYILNEYVGFRELIETDFCHKKFQNVHTFVSDASSGACNVEISRLLKVRGRNEGEVTIVQHFDDLIEDFPIAAGFTLNSLDATHEMIECNSGKSGKSKGSKSAEETSNLDD